MVTSLAVWWRFGVLCVNHILIMLLVFLKVEFVLLESFKNTSERRAKQAMADWKAVVKTPRLPLLGDAGKIWSMVAFSCRIS